LHFLVVDTGEPVLCDLARAHQKTNPSTYEGPTYRFGSIGGLHIDESTRVLATGS
jgi:hypothetical protein